MRFSSSSRSGVSTRIGHIDFVGEESLELGELRSRAFRLRHRQLASAGRPFRGGLAASEASVGILDTTGERARCFAPGG